MDCFLNENKEQQGWWIFIGSLRGRTKSCIHSSPWKASWEPSKVRLVHSAHSLTRIKPALRYFFNFAGCGFVALLRLTALPYPLRSPYLRPKPQISPISVFLEEEPLKEVQTNGLRPWSKTMVWTSVSQGVGVDPVLVTYNIITFSCSSHTFQIWHRSSIFLLFATWSAFHTYTGSAC